VSLTCNATQMAGSAEGRWLCTTPAVAQIWLCLQLMFRLVKAAVHMHLVAPGALEVMLMLPRLQSSDKDSEEAQALVEVVIGM